MKIYSSSMYGRGTIFVSPGAEHPETSDFIDESTDAEGRVVRKPRQYAVKFDKGMAEVPDNLGRYMIDKGMASASRLIVPRPPAERLLEGRPKYPPPIAVGRPLANLGEAGA